MRKRFNLKIRWPFLALVFLVLLAVWQYQAIHDWVRLSNYSPPASVSQLADDITATPEARKLFYVNHPAIEDRESFGRACSARGEHTIVLGCYHPVDRGIFIFHVSDDRLNGVDQVTAAHEVLHAAYDRLTPREQKKVDGMLNDYFKNHLYDERVKSIVASYQKTEPNDVVNEMHSIFGTEIAVLPAELETYYRRYFQDRGKVVQFAASYQQEFTSRQSRVSTFDTTLRSMKQQIDDNTARLDDEENQIASLRTRLESERNAGNYEAYNTSVPVYNNRIESYNQLIASTRTLIADYNRMVNERNQLALQVAELARSIDSSFQPINQ
ncbi:MAG TPA: hypothetical protein VF572_01350 [Candidatus Saccharimonadales bacterium]|jgi:hypothetical protein